MSAPKSEFLRALYWHEEILQFMFWLKGEGLGERASWRTLERLFGPESAVGAPYLDRLVDEGFLVREKGSSTTTWFKLSDKGVEEGRRVSSERLDDLTRPVEGACGPECWCHLSSSEAEACTAERAAWL